MLQWLVFSRRPLLLTELAEVVAIKTDGPPFLDYDARFPEPSDVLSILSSLVTIVAVDGCGEQIRFAHFSVQEYLISDRILASDAKHLAVRQATATTDLAESTCAYLLHLLDCDPEELLSKCQTDYPLLQYATSQWVEHLLLLDKEKAICGLILPLLIKIEFTEAIYQTTLNKSTKDSRGYYLHPLYYPLGFATWLGNADLVQKLLNEGYDVNFQDFRKFENQFRPSFHYALRSRRKHILLPSLLPSGFGHNTWREGFRCGTTILQVATHRRNKQLIQLLVRAGANVNARACARSALHDACRNRDLESARMLVDYGADVNIDGYDGTPLLAALARPKIDVDVTPILELLLDNGADVNAMHYQGQTALLRALNEGNTATVDLLLDRGAVVNIHSETQKPALHIVVKRNDIANTKKLLEHGADVNAIDGSAKRKAELRYDGTAITFASSLGLDDIVRLLLQWDADLHIQAGFYDNALQAACKRGHETFVKLILEKGLDCNLVGGYYGTALQAAAASRRSSNQILQTLMEAGADINIRGGKYGTALQAAVTCSPDPARSEKNLQFQKIQLLLQSGANVNIKGGAYGSPLRAAIYIDWTEVIKLLLKHGAEVIAEDLEFAKEKIGVTRTSEILRNAYDMGLEASEN